MAYVTVADIKAAMPDAIPAGETSYDSILGDLADRASELIDRLTGREVGAYDASASASARIYDGSGKSYQWIDECVEITKVEVKDSPTDDDYVTWSTSDYIVATGSPDYPEYNKTPYTLLLVDINGDYATFTKGPRTVRVTARWGYSDDPPEVVKQAVIIQAVRWFKRGQQAFQDVSGQVELGQLTYAKKIDPDIVAMLYDAGLRRVTV